MGVENGVSTLPVRKDSYAASHTADRHRVCTHSRRLLRFKRSASRARSGGGGAQVKQHDGEGSKEWDDNKNRIANWAMY